MFLGPAGWRGIDSGAVGTAVSYAALWLLPIHLFRHFEEAFFVIATRLRSGYREAMDLDERNR